MFLNKLSELLKDTNFTLSVTTSETNMILVFVPNHEVPESGNDIAKVHAALAMPLRISVENNADADQKVIDELTSYMASHAQHRSNLSHLTKAMAEAEKSVKQSIKKKSDKKTKSSKDDSSNSDKPVSKEDNVSDKSSNEGNKPEKLEL